MGGSSSKVSASVPQVKKTTDALKELISATATSAKRKVKKEGRQYMAPERAQKELEKQKIIPKRAPLNIGNITISEESKKAARDKVEKMQEHDKNFLSMMKNVYVTSDNLGGDKITSNQVHNDQRSSDLQRKLPKLKERQQFNIDEVAEFPRGRTSLKSVIESLYNHKMNPEEWGAVEIAERLRLRESDAESVLKYFELLDGTSIFRSKLPYDSS